MKSIFYSLIIMISFSSCTYHAGTLGGGSGAVSQNNANNIRLAYGSARTTNVFGIGGNKKDALILEAKRSLYRNNPLKDGEVIGQTTVDFKRTFFFPVFATKVVLSAEIIDFSDAPTDSVDARSLNGQSIGRSPGENQFQVGQEVTYRKNQDFYAATVLNFDGRKYGVGYIDDNKNLRFRWVDGSALQSPDEVVTKPLDPAQPDKLFTPQSARGKLVRFQFKGEEYEGELKEKRGDVYIILMEKGNGEFVGFYIPKKDVIDQ